MQNNMLLVFKSRIQENYDHLSSTEQKVADYMLKYPGQVMNQAVTEIAEAAGTSPATVIRFSKSCGFSGLADLKLHIKREYDIVIEDVQTNNVKKEDSIELVKQKVMGAHISVVNSLLNHVDDDAYLKAANLLSEANRILIVSYGASKVAATSLMDFFLQMNVNCEMYEDLCFSTMRLSTMKPGDVLLAINYTGRFRSTIECAKYARELGVSTIIMTAEVKSPIAEFADVLINTNLLNEEYESSSLVARILETTAVEILYTLIATRNSTFAEAYARPHTVLERLRLPNGQAINE